MGHPLPKVLRAQILFEFQGWLWQSSVRKITLFTTSINVLQNRCTYTSGHIQNKSVMKSVYLRVCGFARERHFYCLFLIALPTVLLLRCLFRWPQNSVFKDSFCSTKRPIPGITPYHFLWLTISLYMYRPFQHILWRENGPARVACDHSLRVLCKLWAHLAFSMCFVFLRPARSLDLDQSRWCEGKNKQRFSVGIHSTQNNLENVCRKGWIWNKQYAWYPRRKTFANHINRLHTHRASCVAPSPNRMSIRIPLVSRGASHAPLVEWPEALHVQVLNWDELFRFVTAPE